jgi:hypothetical protein
LILACLGAFAMLTIFGSPRAGQRMCDGLSRRSFLRIGGMALGGLSLAQVLAASSDATRR